MADNKAKYISVAVITEGEQSRAIPGSPAAPSLGCEPGSGATGNLYLGTAYLTYPDNSGDNDGNLLLNLATNAITFAPTATNSSPDGSTGITSCPLVTLDGEIGYAASVIFDHSQPPTISQFNLLTQTKITQTTAAFDPTGDDEYVLLCVRRTDNHLFFLRTPNSPAPGRLYHLDDALNLVGFYQETGTETPFGFGALQGVGPACATACGVDRLYVVTEPHNDGALVFDISGANPVFLRYVVFPMPQPAPTWNSATTYAAGDVVFFSTDNFQSQQNGNLNHAPVPTLSFWAPDSPAGTKGALPWNPATSYNAGNLASFGALNYASLTNTNINNQPSTNGIWWGNISSQQHAVANVNQEGARSVVCDCNDNALIFVTYGSMSGDPTKNHGGLLRIGPNDTSSTDITPANWMDETTYQWNINWGIVLNTFMNGITYDLGNKVLIVGGLQNATPYNTPPSQYRLAAYDTTTNPATELWHIDDINSWAGEVSSNVTNGQLKMIDWTDGQVHSSGAAIIRTIDTLTGATISTVNISGLNGWITGFGWYNDYLINGWTVQARS